MKRVLGWVVVIAALATFPARAEVPLPVDISISAPTPEIRKELAAFSGKWEGNWSGNLDAVLIIEKIDNEKADLIYAWGDAPVWNTKKAYGRYKAKVAPNGGAELTFQNPSGTINFTVTMNRDLSSVNVQRMSPTGSAIETFKRVAP
jgi:hypothetical protein